MAHLEAESYSKFEPRPPCTDFPDGAPVLSVAPRLGPFGSPLVEISVEVKVSTMRTSRAYWYCLSLDRILALMLSRDYEAEPFRLVPFTPLLAVSCAV